jgi:hypothetical protein
MHTCDNPACINLEHLRAATQIENMQDMVNKGRASGGAPLGEKHGKSKLTNVQVYRIKELLPAFSDAYIGGLYDVTAACIHRIRIGSTWKHLK